MYKIGDFSGLSKTTVKTLRYYEKEGLLLPTYIDKFTGYRYYETSQLLDLARIIAYRQVGISIENIKKIISGSTKNNVLTSRKKNIENEIVLLHDQLSKINYLLEENNMKYEVVFKELPDDIVYYMEGVIDNFGKITEFILDSGDKCRNLNPTLKCKEPEYCYVSYLDGEYKEKNIKIRYSQAVVEKGVESDEIKFEQLKPIQAACIYYKGAYSDMREAYGFILKWIEDNNYEITEPIRERYIDGVWNKEKEEDYLTEIQVPVRKK